MDNIFFFLFCFSLRLSTAKKASFNVEFVTLGFIPPASYASLAYLGPAFHTGVQQVRHDFQDVFNVSEVILAENISDCLDLSTKCDDIAGQYFYQRKTKPEMTVFIVPGCIDTTYTNRLVAQWNILYITSVYADPIIRKKSLSPTWISTTPVATNNFVMLYITLLRKFQWTRVYFILDEVAVPFFSSGMGPAVFIAFKAEAGNQGTMRLINSAKNTNYSSVLEDFRQNSRICVFFGHAKQMKILLKQAALANMTDGDYIYIGLDIFLDIKFGNFMWDEYNTTKEDSIPSQSLKSLLLISLDSSTNKIKPAGAQLDRIWREMAEKHFNYTSPVTEKTTPYAFASHAAVEIFGQVLNESLSDSSHFDPSNGKEFVKKFLNRHFQTTVADVYIDSVGEPRVDLILRQFDQDLGSFKTVAVHYSKNASLIDSADIQWPNGYGPPLNRPLCGYTSQKNSCILTENRIDNAAYSIAAVCSACVVAGCLFLFYNRFYRKTLTSELWWKLKDVDLKSTVETLSFL